MCFWVFKHHLIRLLCLYGYKFYWDSSKKTEFRVVLLSSISFFVITNFGVWLLGYPKTWTGLAECYTLALPFFRNLMGDLFYSGVLIFGFDFIQKRYLQEAR